MAEISFTPTFTDFRDYIDGEDLVRAEGPTGFNAWFGAIEQDLNQFSTVVTAIDARLDQLEQPPGPRRLVLPLRLLRTGATAGWIPGGAGAASPAGLFGGEPADGSMNLVLPDGVLLQSLRATGQAHGVTITVVLSAVPITGAGNPQELKRLTADSTSFDVTGQIENIRVDTGSFTYRIRATVGAGAANVVAAVITSLSLTVTG